MRPNRSEAGEKKGIVGRHTAHSIEIQNRRGLSLYKLKRNRATVSFTFSFYQTPLRPHLPSIPRVSSTFFPPVFGGGGENRASEFRGKRRGRRGDGSGEKRENCERGGSTIPPFRPRKKRIEIAQDSRTEMEVRHRIRDFHHRESFPRSRLHEIMFPRPEVKRRRVGKGKGGLFNRPRPAERIFNGRLPRRTASKFSSPVIGDASSIVSPKYSTTETFRLRFLLFL